MLVMAPRWRINPFQLLELKDDASRLFSVVRFFVCLGVKVKYPGEVYIHFYLFEVM